MNSFESVDQGMLIAVWAPDNDARPQIAKVIERNNSELNIHWLVGSYNGTWKEAYHGIATHRTQWTDTIPVESCILWDFTLTKKGCLKKATADELKKKYSELDASRSDSDDCT
ncbi:nipped-B-like protein A [Ptychodera flava]|uniref:nipped-B-like protein A n=1 Tax=Ptychodera flava TaxID=63121 RepID=UPI00396A8E1A